MKVGIYSPGTVGKRVIHAILANKNLLGIKELVVFKRTPDKEYMSVLEMMKIEGAKFAFERGQTKAFSELGIEADYEKNEALSAVDVLIDCSAEGVSLGHKKDYKKIAKKCRGFICQGAEEDYGFSEKEGPFIYGLNHDAFNFRRDRFIQIGSCNTHAGSFLLKAITSSLGLQACLESGCLLDIRFNFIRRSLDLNQKSKSVLSTQVSGHADSEYGTHHAKDIAAAFRLKGIELKGKILSSAVKINEPYMHIVNFSFVFDHEITKEDVLKRLESESRILFTERDLAHYTFQWGTDYGFKGRFSNPCIVALNTVEVFKIGGGRCEVRGHAFTPQDGNFLLSNLAAMVGFLFPTDQFENKMRELEKLFLCPIRRI